MRELFIYWKTSAARADAAERGAAEWQAELRGEFPALAIALYRRPDAPDPTGPATATLMETYAGAALDPALERRIAIEGDARLQRWIDGPRKVEVFVRCLPV
jgi:hypothetical protein